MLRFNVVSDQAATGADTGTDQSAYGSANLRADHGAADSSTGHEFGLGVMSPLVRMHLPAGLLVRFLRYCGGG
jgi:hypothetical protein